MIIDFGVREMGLIASSVCLESYSGFVSRFCHQDLGGD